MHSSQYMLSNGTLLFHSSIKLWIFIFKIILIKIFTQLYVYILFKKRFEENSVFFQKVIEL